MRFSCLRTDTGAGAFSNLTREAGAFSAFQPERSPAQPGLDGETSQRFARIASRVERPVKILKGTGIDRSRRDVVGRGGLCGDMQRDHVGTAPQPPVVRGK